MQGIATLPRSQRGIVCARIEAQTLGREEPRLYSVSLLDVSAGDCPVIGDRADNEPIPRGDSAHNAPSFPAVALRQGCSIDSLSLVAPSLLGHLVALVAPIPADPRRSPSIPVDPRRSLAVDSPRPRSPAPIPGPDPRPRSPAPPRPRSPGAGSARLSFHKGLIEMMVCVGFSGSDGFSDWPGHAGPSNRAKIPLL